MTAIETPEELDQRLVLAHADVAFGVRAKRVLRRLGWDVTAVRSAAGARRLARELVPAVVVLDTDLPDESGWLVCKKLTDERPDLRVLLIGSRAGTEQARFAAFVGAAQLLRQRDGVAGLAGALGGAALPAGR